MPPNKDHRAARLPHEHQSAYWANTNTNSYAVPSQDRSYLPVPTYQDWNRAPEQLEKKKRKPATLRSLIRRVVDETHSPQGSPQPYAQPEPLHSAPPTMIRYPRSLSPAPTPPGLSRAHSTALASSPPAVESALRPSRSVSWNPQSPRQYPQTYLGIPSPPRRHHHPASSTEAFDHPSDFHLFVAATSGFSSSDPFTPSPQSPPRSNLQAPQSQSQVQSHSSSPPIPRINTHHLRLSSPRDPRSPSMLSASDIEAISGDERDGAAADADDDDDDDDELPDYAQSQAEMQELQRREAARRARELEMRWMRARRGERGR